MIRRDLKGVTRGTAWQHTPIERDYAAKFALSQAPAAQALTPCPA
jgi:hypothetical protein